MSRIPTTLALGLLLCGCPNPNAYTVPRTLDPGDAQMTVAPEVFAYHFTGPGGAVTGLTPTGPSVGFRYGASDRVDVGGRMSSMVSPTADVKVQLLRGPVDIAVDPGIQLMYLEVSDSSSRTTPSPNAAVLELYGPVLVGFNLSSSLTLVVSPGVGFAVGTSKLGSDSRAVVAAQTTGLMGRFGLGVDIRTSEHFALHPEVTVMRAFDDAQTLMAVFGLGLNVGAMPDYSDIGQVVQ